jgi:hypothetical protein
MDGMFATKPAVFLPLEAIRGGAFVLHRRIIALTAVIAG